MNKQARKLIALTKKTAIDITYSAERIISCLPLQTINPIERTLVIGQRKKILECFNSTLPDLVELMKRYNVREDYAFTEEMKELDDILEMANITHARFEKAKFFAIE